MLAQPARERGVFVYIWFDIEDYVTSEADDVPLRAFSILEKHGVPVTCKLVAEKVRALKEHGREDVISAISKQDVGYHLDSHSRHPTVYEYFVEADTISGGEEFYRREREGLELVERTFSRKASCFGHPGTAWSPHYYPALRKMGVPVYLDESSILNLGGAPYWYCGMLNLNGANENFILFDYTFEDPSGIARVKERFMAIHERLRGEGGTVSILFHLHTTINKKFWDEVNFGRGRNTEKEAYVRPPAQPSEVTERAWKDFDEFVGYMASFADVRFITARDAVPMYERPVVRVSRSELAEVVEKIGPEQVHISFGDEFLSLSEVFYLVAKNLATYAETGVLPAEVALREPYGPLRAAPSRVGATVTAREILELSRKALTAIEEADVIPSELRLQGGGLLSPVDFLPTASGFLRGLLSGTEASETSVIRGDLLETKHVDDEAFRKACQWAVLPAGFYAPKILEQIKLQTWTLRPAVLKREPSQRRRGGS